MLPIKTKNWSPPGGQKRYCKTPLLYLEQIFKLVDAETQFSHTGLEQLPQTVLLHQTYKNTKRLLFWHLSRGTSSKMSVLLKVTRRNIVNLGNTSDSTCLFQHTEFNASLDAALLRALPALAAGQQWMHFLDSSPPLDPPESMPEYTHTNLVF